MLSFEEKANPEYIVGLKLNLRWQSAINVIYYYYLFSTDVLNKCKHEKTYNL